MADVGPGPPDLIRKRITAEIKRLEFQIESQELEVLELHDRIRRCEENVAASHEEIERQHGNLAALDNAHTDTEDD